MKVAAPQLPSTLNTLNDFTNEIRKDETLTEIHVEYADVHGVRLNSLACSEAKITQTIFSQATLERTIFTDIIFLKCTFTATKLPEASWQRVLMQQIRASGIQLQNSTIKNVSFEDSKMDLANFRFTKLQDVSFKNCDLTEADFYNATIENVSFENCRLDKVEFSSSTLKNVDLRTSDIAHILGVQDLSGAIIDSIQLMGLAPRLAAEYKIIVKD